MIGMGGNVCRNPESKASCYKSRTSFRCPLKCLLASKIEGIEEINNYMNNNNIGDINAI